MKNLTPNEKNILQFHINEDFRNVTNDNVKEFVSIFEKLDPETAKELIERMPEAIKGLVEIHSHYFNLLKSGMDSSMSTTKPCFDTEGIIVGTLSKEVEKDIPFEQKRYYVEKMEDAVERMERKDTEHRSTIDKVMKYGGIALAVGLSVLVSIFLGINNDGPRTKNQ